MARLGMDTRGPHVVHVIGTLRTGGAEKQLVNLLLAADKTAFRYTVLCLTEPGELAPQVEAAGIPVKVMRVRMRRLVPDLLALAAWMRRERARVVHSHMHASALWARLAGLLAGAPVLVVTEHGKENWKGRVRIALDRWLSRATWRHICVSQDILAIRRSREKVAAAKLLVVPNGVPVPDLADQDEMRRRRRAEFGLDPARPVIGSVGRVVEAKAYHDLLSAVRLLRRERPDICWLQVGDGPLRDELAASIRSHGLEDNVIMAGRRDDVGDLLAAMDVWVMSSIREGLPVSLLEAMAAGRPIAATRVGGIPDAVSDGETGRLVAAGDPAALAQAIADLLGNPAHAKEMATAARRHVIAAFGIEAVARRVEDVYRSGLAKHGHEEG